jgi:hypothetical protein
MGEDRRVSLNDLFGSDEQWPETRLKEAARLRALAADATTDAVKKHLEDRAREHERLAGGFDRQGTRG